MSTPYIPNPEELGRRRFPDDKPFRKQLYNNSINYLSQIQGLTPSNYPKDPSTNLSVFNRVHARELARLNLSANSINNDKQYTATRVKYLQEILGERLGLGTRIAPVGYNSESYRDYLVSIKDAYLKGSKLSVMEALASKFIGFEVIIKELYLQARNPASSLDVTSANKIVVQVLVDDLIQLGYNINTLKADLDFFIGLTRPAHVLYDSQLLWVEQIDVNKVHDILYGDLGGGCVPVYDYSVDNEPSLLALQVFVLPNATGATGLIDSIHHNDLIFYFDNSIRVITEPGMNGTQFYDVYGRRGNFDTLEIGQYVRMSYLIIPGDFQFWYYPSMILPTWQSMFYRDVYRLPLFQESVKKVMDAHGRFPLQIKSTPTTICDRWVQDVLVPMYEDLRGVCAGTNARDYKVTLNSRMGSPNFSWPYSPADIYDSALLGSNYNFWMEHTPLTDGSSNPVTIYDVGVVFDGTAITDSLTTIDASSGRLSLTEYQPYWDSTVGRLPVPGDEFIFSYHYLQDGTNFDATSSKVFGISYWQMPVAPMIAGDGTTTLAGIDNVSVLVDGTTISNVITDLDALLGHVSLQTSGDFWRASELGRLPAFSDTTSSTFVVNGTGSKTFYVETGKSLFSGQSIYLSSTDTTSSASMKGDITSYNSMTGQLVCNIDTTTGTGSYNRWQITAGDVFEFDYFWGVKLQYGLLFDDPGRVLDGYFSSQQTYNMLMDGDSIVNHPVILRQDTTAQILVPGVADTTSNPASPISYRWQLQAPVVGSAVVSIDSVVISGAVASLDTTSGILYLQSSDSFWNASVLGHQPTTANTLLISYSYGQVIGDPVEDYSISLNSPEEIGYRYRMYQLHHSSVLNSPDTLLLNGYQKPALRASIINQQPAVNHFNKVWSAEFLNDTNPVPELSDDYLDNGLDPVVKLKPGTPTFQQTFSYQPGLIYQRKLQDIRENHRLLMYSDLLLKEFIEGDSDIPLSSICDGDNVGFKVRIGEEIPLIEECEPWILFDSVKVNSIEMSIPGYYEGIPNLRVEDKLIRNNFILRERESTGVGDVTYSVTTSEFSDQTSFQLPASFEYTYIDEVVNFPSLPIVNISGGYASISNISVTINGVSGTILSLDATTGLVTIQAPALQQRIEQEITITPEMEAAKEIYLHCNSNQNTTTLTVIYGTSQYYSNDFIVYGPYLSWLGGPLDGLLSAGDKIRVSYLYDPLLNADVVFSYMIRNHQFINVVDRDWSRIMDDKYVFPGRCADIEDVRVGLNYDEYYGMLDDGSDGIKLSFFNHSTLQYEEHIFSGPVFETYDVSTDQIGAPENFYNALVRINNPLSINNPLNYSADYGFMNDALVRFRKKTFKELLPNRTFRTMQITEMLPI